MHNVLYMQCPEVENTEAVVNKKLVLDDEMEDDDGK